MTVDSVQVFHWLHRHHVGRLFLVQTGTISNMHMRHKNQQPNDLIPRRFKRNPTPTTATTATIAIGVPRLTTHVVPLPHSLSQPKFHQGIQKHNLFVGGCQIIQRHEEFTVLMDQQHVGVVMNNLTQRCVGQIIWKITFVLGTPVFEFIGDVVHPPCGGGRGGRKGGGRGGGGGGGRGTKGIGGTV